MSLPILSSRGERGYSRWWCVAIVAVHRVVGGGALGGVGVETKPESWDIQF